MINVAFYKFTPLAELPELRARVRERLQAIGVKGSVLLAPEGVNAMLSGEPEAIEAAKLFATEAFGVDPSNFKKGEVSEHSFNRLLVKIKKEIIPVGDPAVRPDLKTAPYLPAKELKQWLDEGRPVILLDTRNDYEVEVGTFRGARTLNLKTSRDFAAKAAEALPSLQGAPIVSFCTGGIRCEKASAVLENLGARDVYQLEGGILRYFEENGSAHFDGNCFVFDWREAVDGELKPQPRSVDPNAQFGRHI